MTVVSGTYRNGAVELDEKVDWPDGRVVTVVDNEPPANSKDTCVDGSDWDDSPEGIRKWLEWFDSAPPVLNEEELESFEKKSLVDARVAGRTLLVNNERCACKHIP